MRAIRSGTVRGLLPCLARAVAASLVLGCAGVGGPHATFDWVDNIRPSAGLGPARFLWVQKLSRDFEGAYVPVEHATALVDASRDRLFVGTTYGEFLLLDGSGARHASVRIGGGVGGAPVLDDAGTTVFVGSEEGTFFALDSASLEKRWEQKLGGAVRELPVVVPGTVYVTTDADVVFALDRNDGTILWRYGRDAPETMSVSGHAGLYVDDKRVVAAFTDGAVVALSPIDGSVLWERETSLDVEPDEARAPRFVDVDTTPVLIDGVLWVASFAGGLYGLSPATGAVEWHDEDTKAVTAITLAGERVYLASGDDGVIAMSKDDRSVYWTHAFERGSLSRPVVAAGTVLVAEKGGPFVALDAESGFEVNRMEAGYGFSAPPAVAQGLGFVVSNGGSLFAFRLSPPPPFAQP